MLPVVCTLFLFISWVVSCSKATSRFHQALISDNLPPSSIKCLMATNITTSFNFTWNDKPLNFSDVNKAQEKKLFLIEMSNLLQQNNTKEPKGWTMRISKGGNVYSFMGPWGQAVAPNVLTKSPFMDEVWQDVAVSNALNNPNGGKPYFIHQAGAYFDQAANPTLLSPWYSPNAGAFCLGHSCSIVSWSQHAHLPTTFNSSKLVFTRYTNCGNGVYEHVFGIHNMATDPSVGPPSDTLDYFNTLWWGVRTSTFRDVVRSSSSSSNLTEITPLPNWDAVGVLPVSQTAGYTVFAEYVRFDSPTYPLPCGSRNGNGSFAPCSDTANSIPLTLKLKAGPKSDPGPCHYQQSLSEFFKIYTVRCRLEPTVNLTNGVVDGKNLSYFILANPTTKAIMHLHPLRSVTAWSRYVSGFNWMIVSPADNSTKAADINKKFPAGTTIQVQYEPPYILPCGDGSGAVVGCSSSRSKGQPAIYMVSLTYPAPSSNACEQDTDMTALYGKAVARCRIFPTVPINSGDPYTSLTFVSNNTNAQISYQVNGVLYWAYKNPMNGYQYIYVFAGDGGMPFLRNNFYPGLNFTVLYQNMGKPWDQNMALSSVHGSSATLKENLGGSAPGTMNVYDYTNIRYGIAGNPARDYTPFTMRTMTAVTEGSTYVKRHFMIADRLDKMQNRSLAWLNETFQSVNPPTDPGKLIQLVRTSISSFGAALENETCLGKYVQAPFVCYGYTKPQRGYYAHFAITCGSQYYFGTNRYYFAPNSLDQTKRPWVCGSNSTLSPSYIFLGFYPPRNCTTLNGLKYDSLGCGP